MFLTTVQIRIISLNGVNRLVLQYRRTASYVRCLKQNSDLMQPSQYYHTISDLIHKLFSPFTPLHSQNSPFPITSNCPVLLFISPSLHASNYY